MRIAFVILLLALGFLPSRRTLAEPPAAESPGKLESLKNTYSSHMSKIESDASKNVNGWPLEYLKGVKTVQQEMQKAGDLEGWQVCQNEFDRFQADRSLTTHVLVEKPAALRATQDKYMGAEAGCLLEKQRAIASLTGKYLEHLTELQKELTVAGKIKEALAVNAEINATKADARVTRAEFDLAEHNVRNPPPATAIEKPAAADPSSPAPPLDMPPLVATSPDVTVYAPNKTPPSSELKFKKLNLKPVALGRGDSGIMANAMDAEVPKITEKRMEVFGTAVNNKQTDIAHHLRLSMRLRGNAVNGTNIALVVQYFISDFGQTGGKVLPRQAAIKLASLPRLGPETIFVDLPPVRTTTWENEQRGPGKPGIENRRGQQFEGIAVVLFDNQRTAVAQFTSDKSLNSLVVTNLPRQTIDPSQVQTLHEALQTAREALKKAPDDPALRKAFRDARHAFEAARNPGIDIDRAE